MLLSKSALEGTIASSTNVDAGGLAKSGRNSQRRIPSTPVRGPSKSSSQTLVKMPGVPGAGGGPSRCGGWKPSTQSLARHGRLNLMKVGAPPPASMSARSKATALARPLTEGKSRSER